MCISSRSPDNNAFSSIYVYISGIYFIVIKNLHLSLVAFAAVPAIIL